MIQELSSNHIQALKLLRSHREPLNAKFFANNFSISSKSVHNELNELNLIIANYGAGIISKAGVGYTLSIDDDERFRTFCDLYLDDYLKKEHMSINCERAHYIVRYLLSHTEYVRIEDLEEQLFVNRTTVISRLNIAKTILHEFDLKVVNKSKHGLRIEGHEHNIRACIIYEFFFLNAMTLHIKDPENFQKNYQLDDQLFTQIKALIIRYQNAYTKNNLPEYVVDNIVRAIYLAYCRNQKGQTLHFSIQARQRFSGRNSYYVAKILLDNCGELLNCQFNIDDIIEITIYIIGYRVLTDFNGVSYSDDYLKSRDLALDLIGYLEKVNTFQYIGKDVRLADEFSLQLTQILLRCEFKLKMSLFDGQHKTSLMADKLAVQTAVYLKERTGFRLDKDEIFRLSLLIYPIFGRYPFQFTKVKAVLVPKISKSVGLGIAERLMRNYSSILDSVEVFEYYELTQLDLSAYQVLFTSIRDEKLKAVSNQIKTIYLDIFFDENDKIEIRQQLFAIVIKNVFDYHQFFSTKNVIYNLNWRTKDQCLKQLSLYIEQTTDTEKGLLADLLRYESFYSSRERDNVVFVSPILSHTKTACLFVFVLRKPITWSFKKVQIIVYWDRGLLKEQAISFENESVTHVIEIVFRDKNVINLLRNNDDPKKITQFYQTVNDMVLSNARSFK
ncbi:MAG: HTH domain-containing protein [Erysipelotrichaceae bacterium]|nr:HTH domain-containing protein [Erysipelotrichaceae bacterium]